MNITTTQIASMLRNSLNATQFDTIHDLIEIACDNMMVKHDANTNRELHMAEEIYEAMQRNVELNVRDKHAGANHITSEEYVELNNAETDKWTWNSETHLYDREERIGGAA